MGNQGRFISRLLVIVSTMLCADLAIAEVQGDFVAGEYVVQLKDQVGALSENYLAKMMGGQIKSRISRHQNTLVLKRSILERPELVMADLSRNSMVDIVEPNYIYSISSLPNDLHLDELWGLKNSFKSSGGVDIDAEKAWSITTGSRNVVVAVIDTGVNYRHPDLKNNMWVNQAEAQGTPGVDDDGNGFVDDIYGYDFANRDGDPMDDNDHGSHCAGTIGAEGDNGIGVVGVNWQVSIMALKFLTGSGSGTLENALKSIDYATQMGVDIMSNSWGGGGKSATLQQAIERAEKAGILFVAAAGNATNNNDKNPSYPASYDVSNVISVAAVNNRGSLASFSNYGANSVHIAAPGVNIFSTVKNQSYKSLSGTSMATPHVSGVAALLLAQNPQLTDQDLKEILLNSSADAPQLNGRVKHGILNAFNALTDDSLPPPESNDPSQWPSQGVQHSTAHPYENNQVQRFEINVPGATQLSAHFARFETEEAYDKVFFYDGNGNPYGEWTGNHSESFSPVVAGDTLVVEFKSDFSLPNYGFDIDRVHFQGDYLVTDYDFDVESVHSK